MFEFQSTYFQLLSTRFAIFRNSAHSNGYTRCSLIHAPPPKAKVSFTQRTLDRHLQVKIYNYDHPIAFLPGIRSLSCRLLDHSAITTSLFTSQAQQAIKNHNPHFVQTHYDVPPLLVKLKGLIFGDGLIATAAAKLVRTCQSSLNKCHKKYC